MSNKPIKAYLVAAGIFHDIGFARLELLKLLAEHDDIIVRVAEDYSDMEAIEQSDFLITYTCNIVPSVEQQQCLQKYIESGKHWFALHGTNTILQLLDNGKVGTTNTAPLFTETLGSVFLAHPSLQEFTVTPTENSHALTKGLQAFKARDEIYLIESQPNLTVLLETKFGGKTEIFENDDHPEQSYPVLYLHQVGKGRVLYLTLGHCNGHYNNPLQDFVPEVERCSWQQPIFYDLLRRGINWARGPVFN